MRASFITAIAVSILYLPLLLSPAFAATEDITSPSKDTVLLSNAGDLDASKEKARNAAESSQAQEGAPENTEQKGFFSRIMSAITNFIFGIFSSSASDSEQSAPQKETNNEAGADDDFTPVDPDELEDDGYNTTAQNTAPAKNKERSAREKEGDERSMLAFFGEFFKELEDGLISGSLNKEKCRITREGLENFKFEWEMTIKRLQKMGKDTPASEVEKTQNKLRELGENIREFEATIKSECGDGKDYETFLPGNIEEYVLDATPWYFIPDKKEGVIDTATPTSEPKDTDTPEEKTNLKDEFTPVDPEELEEDSIDTKTVTKGCVMPQKATFVSYPFTSERIDDGHLRVGTVYTAYCGVNSREEFESIAKDYASVLENNLSYKNPSCASVRVEQMTYTDLKTPGCFFILHSKQTSFDTNN